MAETIVELVSNVHQAAVNVGMGISPKDTAFIISLFLEGFTQVPPAIPEVDAMIHRIVEEVNKVADE